MYFVPKYAKMMFKYLEIRTENTCILKDRAMGCWDTIKLETTSDTQKLSKQSLTAHLAAYADYCSYHIINFVMTASTITDQLLSCNSEVGCYEYSLSSSGVARAASGQHSTLGDRYERSGPRPQAHPGAPMCSSPQRLARN